MEYATSDPTNYSPSSTLGHNTPLINFIISPSPGKKIRQGSLFLNGKLSCVDANGDPIDAGDEVSFDPSTGIYGLIDSLTIKNANNNNLETIKSYNRFMASFLKQSQNLGDLATSFNMFANTSSNYYSTSEQVMNYTTSFSIPLFSGLLLSTDYLLDPSKLNGCNIEIMLSSDANFFFDTHTGTNATGCKYELTDVQLSYELEPMSQDEMGIKEITYNTIISHHTTLDSNYNTINFRVGEPLVQSFFINCVDQTFANNSNKNSMDTSPIIDASGNTDTINRVEILKAGVKTPLKFNLEANGKTGSILGTDLYRNFYDSFRPFMTGGNNSRNPVNTPKLASSSIVDVGGSFGIGCAYNNVSHQGENFTNDQFGLIIHKDSTNPKPYSVNVFFKVSKIMTF